MFLRILLLFLCGLVPDVKGQSTSCNCNNRDFEPVCGGPESGPGDVIQFLNQCALEIFNCNNSEERYVVKYTGECVQTSSAYASAPIIVHLQSLSTSALSGSGMENQGTTHDSIPSSSSTKSSTTKLNVIKSSLSSEQETSLPLMLQSSISQPDVIHVTAQTSGTLKSLSTVVSLPDSAGATVNIQTFFTDQDLNSAETVPTPSTTQMQSTPPVSSNTQLYQKPVLVHYHHSTQSNDAPDTISTTQTEVEDEGYSDTLTPYPSTISYDDTMSGTLSGS